MTVFNSVLIKQSCPGIFQKTQGTTHPVWFRLRCFIDRNQLHIHLSRFSFLDDSPFTHQTWLLSDKVMIPAFWHLCCYTHAAVRKQVSGPLIWTEPCGDSAENQPVECVACMPEIVPSESRTQNWTKPRMWDTCCYWSQWPNWVI